MNEVSKFISIEENETTNSANVGESAFKVCSSNLPAKPTFFTKLKNILFYEIKVELTPYEQKIEDEINEFLHQEVKWSKISDFLFKEVEITFNGKRII